VAVSNTGDASDGEIPGGSTAGRWASTLSPLRHLGPGRGTARPDVRCGMTGAARFVRVSLARPHELLPVKKRDPGNGKET
jgi:hypothetical protein